MQIRCRFFIALFAFLIATTLGSAQATDPTVAQATRFMAQAESTLAVLGVKVNQAQWVQQNFITEDSEVLSADAQNTFGVAVQQLAMAARRFDGITLPAALRRKFLLLKLSLAAPPPADAAEAAELTTLTVGMDADYGRGTYCRPAKSGTGEECRQLGALSRVLAESRDPADLLDAWQGWHRISVPMRPRYQRFVDLANKGARGMGFVDAGAMWRAGYDMPPDDLAKEADRLWEQVKPLYVSLHAYVRARLVERYGSTVVPADGLIPAHLLGNMWAQEWGNIYPLVAPKAAAETFDLTKLLQVRGTDAKGMARYAEAFFTSLGFAPLPESFWTRSLFTKPRDREVVCHASAWDIDNKDDLRIKMCIEVTGEDFVTVHHEEGHNFYQRAYQHQSFLHQGGANDGFHEAVGDAIALAITPEYLKQAGLLDRVAGPEGDISLLLRQAMDKVAFLPFGLLVDQWRWKVFSGETKPEAYNASWWALRARYQGVAPPLPRSERDFDPAAKYHVAANVPYTRYFLARVLQFQFYRALCRAAEVTGPLHRCTFSGNKAAGAKLAAMLESGASRPWQETLFAMTGEHRMDGGAILEYFAPLKAWLDEQNRGKPVAW
jgi:peptidyl-dipeptidase A